MQQTEYATEPRLPLPQRIHLIDILNRRGAREATHTLPEQYELLAR